jgi:phosphodiesterase/alkaline phosphatase D-like protein
MLDDRSCRDAPPAPGPAAGDVKPAMLGEAQLGWLCKGLKESRAAFKIVACASPILGDGPNSWGAYKAERDEFLAWLFKNHISGVVFVSGGNHLGELSTRPAAEKSPTQYPLYELSSSPLMPAPPAPAGEAAPETLPANPLRVGNPVSECNFGTLTFAGPRDKRHVTLRLYDAAGAVKIDAPVFADQLHGQ